MIMSKVTRLGALLRAAAVLCGMLGITCDNADCEKLRDDLYAERLKWETCETDEDCELVGGNTQDCTGIFSCNLGINSRYVKDAQRRIASLPEESVDCHKCGSPNCPEGTIVVCDPAYNRCIVIKELINGMGASVYLPGHHGVGGSTSGTGGSTDVGGSGGDTGAGGESGFGGVIGQGLPTGP
jgi:hypothetical protein